MNNLAEVCFVGLGVGGKYLRCLVIVVKSVGNGGAKRSGADFKVMILRGEGGKPQRGDSFYRGS